MLKALARKLPRALLFALLYLRNLPQFDGDHVRAAVATRMDVDLLKRRRAGVRKARP